MGVAFWYEKYGGNKTVEPEKPTEDKKIYGTIISRTPQEKLMTTLAFLAELNWRYDKDQGIPLSAVSQKWVDQRTDTAKKRELQTYKHQEINKFYREEIIGRKYFSGNTLSATEQILEFLDQHGNCSSITAGNKYEQEAKMHANSMDILSGVPLWKHSLGVAHEVIQSNKGKPELTYMGIIAALAHDLGKIPAAYDVYSASGPHQNASLAVLAQMSNVKALSCYKELTEAIVMHHTKKTANNTLQNILIDADQQARFIESGSYLKDMMGKKQSPSHEETPESAHIDDDYSPETETDTSDELFNNRQGSASGPVALAEKTTVTHTQPVTSESSPITEMKTNSIQDPSPELEAADFTSVFSPTPEPSQSDATPAVAEPAQETKSPTPQGSAPGQGITTSKSKGKADAPKDVVTIKADQDPFHTPPIATEPDLGGFVCPSKEFPVPWLDPPTFLAQIGNYINGRVSGGNRYWSALYKDCKAGLVYFRKPDFRIMILNYVKGTPDENKVNNQMSTSENEENLIYSVVKALENHGSVVGGYLEKGNSTGRFTLKKKGQSHDPSKVLFLIPFNSNYFSNHIAQLGPRTTNKHIEPIQKVIWVPWHNPEDTGE